MTRAAIVLCGGQSTRMGVSKALLPFGDELMVQRVLRRLAPVVSHRLVVAAPRQELPDLPAEVTVLRDRRERRGPLEAILAGLTYLDQQRPAVQAAFITSCDVPLLQAPFVEQLFQWLQAEDEIVVPRDSQFHHPLSAVYRPALATQVADLVQRDQMRPVYLFQQARTRVVSTDALRQVDPELLSLWNLNRPEDYRAALAHVGLTVPAEIEARLQAHRPTSDDPKENP